MSLHTDIRQQLQTLLAQTTSDEVTQLNNALRLLSKCKRSTAPPCQLA